ncbi:hypothetical protein WICPIJ_005662 [Wickerhamomyces pijperi]|uniref:Uncharacterized protein n=1 Tax=Wickerhamomyces pijperi TaxID=599730 RepID=A0A9P8TKX1_WICPI|nr:hypothetical protein WICPIJ_005662 [Wickerhamomyces pijperi]
MFRLLVIFIALTFVGGVLGRVPAPDCEDKVLVLNMDLKVALFLPNAMFLLSELIAPFFILVVPAVVVLVTGWLLELSGILMGDSNLALMEFKGDVTITLPPVPATLCPPRPPRLPPAPPALFEGVGPGVDILELEAVVLRDLLLIVMFLSRSLSSTNNLCALLVLTCDNLTGDILKPCWNCTSCVCWIGWSSIGTGSNSVWKSSWKSAWKSSNPIS